MTNIATGATSFISLHYTSAAAAVHRAHLTHQWGWQKSPSALVRRMHQFICFSPISAHATSITKRKTLYLCHNNNIFNNMHCQSRSQRHTHLHIHSNGKQQNCNMYIRMYQTINNDDNNNKTLHQQPHSNAQRRKRRKLFVHVKFHRMSVCARVCAVYDRQTKTTNKKRFILP